MVELLDASHPDREAIERLRYDVYVLEQAKPLAGANHISQRLTDGLDDTAHHFVVRRGEVIVGAGRVNLLSPSHALTHRAGLSHARRFGVETIAYVSKTFLRSDERGLQLSTKLMRGMMEWAMVSGIHVGFCHCRNDLVPLYERLGFRTLPRRWEDEALGPQKLLGIFIDELAANRHFQAASPVRNLDPETARCMRGLRASILEVRLP